MRRRLEPLGCVASGKEPRNLRQRMPGEILRHLGDDALCHFRMQCGSQIAEHARRCDDHERDELLCVSHSVEIVGDSFGEFLFRQLVEVGLTDGGSRNAIGAMTTARPIGALFARRRIVLCDFPFDDQIDVGTRAAIAQEESALTVADQDERLWRTLYFHHEYLQVAP